MTWEAIPTDLINVESEAVIEQLNSKFLKKKMNGHPLGQGVLKVNLKN